MAKISKKVALITGAGKGLGLEIARQLGGQGITVLLGARKLSQARESAEQLVKEGVDALPLQLDVQDDAQIASAVKEIDARFGKLDILINNAGVSTGWSKGPIAREEFNQLLEINLAGPYFVTQAFAPLLKKSGHGRVVNHSSVLGSIGTLQSGEVPADFFTSAYAPSKAGLNMLTAIQARELAADGIKVNAAHPGWVKTDLGGENAPLEVPEGAKTAVELALIGEDGPTGGYFHLGKTLPW